MEYFNLVGMKFEGFLTVMDIYQSVPVADHSKNVHDDSLMAAIDLRAMITCLNAIFQWGNIKVCNKDIDVFIATDTEALNCI